MSIGNQGFAFQNHAEKTVDIEPLWAGIIPWIVLALIVTGIRALFG